MKRILTAATSLVLLCSGASAQQTAVPSGDRNTTGSIAGVDRSNSPEGLRSYPPAEVGPSVGNTNTNGSLAGVGRPTTSDRAPR